MEESFLISSDSWKTLTEEAFTEKARDNRTFPIDLFCLFPSDPLVALAFSDSKVSNIFGLIREGEVKL